jgi:hypothetical protein
VTNQQLYIAVGVPMLFNAVLIGLLLALIQAKFDRVDAKFDGVNSKFDAKFDSLNERFDAIDRRFDDMRDLWRAELRRVEEVLDARLKHIEERH